MMGRAACRPGKTAAADEVPSYVGYRDSFHGVVKVFVIQTLTRRFSSIPAE
jgi:hypothetical protein